MEDKIFTVGTTADTAKFEMVKEELGKHFATQPWSDGADVAMVFETLTEPLHLEQRPQELDIPIKIIVVSVITSFRLKPLYQIRWTVLKDNGEHARTIVLPVLDVF